MITFTVAADSSISPEQICKEIFDVDRWSSFKGYGVLPGIAKVTMKSPANSIVGTEFYVENTDGSKHKETVQSFNVGKCLIIKMSDFTSPIKNIATHFIERWDFENTNSGYRVHRTFELHPKNAFASLPLWLISWLIKQAVAVHTRQIANPKQA
ncbi:SRPBCC family protein [Chamaesiphon minutus]|uniref:Polyketide cyclase / dehydrase and lipid transport n=1 Tax=Chamaesiphon minutus (strain ATCC 27169 / PCC 6605) TaxID=1173020 RepID=K9UA25_CHAP6|nr:SRPBCC family protein [Chamaesiphon minutus]AFY91685.1 hypothetical protein Cha6605_0388 [Chamaesiphon minutus PCC 6605]